jgi:hypothetical protein
MRLEMLLEMRMVATTELELHGVGTRQTSRDSATKNSFTGRKMRRRKWVVDLIFK